jgi:outer membrane translocation and assembly module TamA
VGGEFFSTGNLELRTPPFWRNLTVCGFMDAGNVIPNRSDSLWEDYRYALGFGLRYALPTGPIRLDWGWNPNRRSDEDLWALHFSVGFPF